MPAPSFVTDSSSYREFQSIMESTVMKTAIIAATFLFALAAPLAAPTAAMADGPGCGVPQGYGTSNPNTFNRSTCGMGSAATSQSAGTAQVPGGQAQGFGTANPYVPNSGAANLGSNTAGPSYDTTPALDNDAANVGAKPAGYGTNNPYIPNSGSARLGSATDSN
jgi:hypothetical protein